MYEKLCKNLKSHFFVGTGQDRGDEWELARNWTKMCRPGFPAEAKSCNDQTFIQFQNFSCRWFCRMYPLNKVCLFFRLFFYFSETDILGLERWNTTVRWFSIIFWPLKMLDSYSHIIPLPLVFPFLHILTLFVGQSFRQPFFQTLLCHLLFDVLVLSLLDSFFLGILLIAVFQPFIPSSWCLTCPHAHLRYSIFFLPDLSFRIFPVVIVITFSIKLLGFQRLSFSLDRLPICIVCWDKVNSNK